MKLTKKQIIIAGIVIALLTTLHLWHYNVAWSCDTWNPVQKLYNYNWKANQGKADLLIGELEVILEIRAYLIERSDNFDYNDYGNLEVRVKTLAYLKNRVEVAYENVLKAITIFVKCNTGV